MDDTVRKQILADAVQQRRRVPVPLYLFGLAWIVISILVLAGLELAWARGMAYFTIGVVLLYMGALVTERLRMENTFRELLEAFESFNRSLYGEDYKVKRAAVDILIHTLEHEDATVRERAHAQLVKISGMDFPAEAGPWNAWWTEAKASFTGVAKEES